MALIIAILFITVLALVVGLLVTGAGGNLQAAVISKQRTALVYTDDAAIDWSINYLRTNPSVCGSTSASTTDLSGSLPSSLTSLNQSAAAPGTQQIEGLTCQDIGGSNKGGPLGQYAVYTTDTTANDAAITQKEGGTATVEGGDVFDRTGTWGIGHSLIIGQGNAINGDKFSGTCPTSISNVMLSDGTITCVSTPSPPSVASPGSTVPACAPYWDTTQQQWIAESLFTSPIVALSVPEPVAGAYVSPYQCATPGTPPGAPGNVDANGSNPQNPKVGNQHLGGRIDGSCQIFMPGMYTTPPVVGNDAYFVSGAYYFDFVGGGTWTISNNNSLFGGEVPTTDSTVSSTTPCIKALAGVNDWDTTAATEGGGTVDSQFVEGGSGVKWFFGGASNLNIKNNASLELFDRVYSCSAPCTSASASESAAEGAQDFSVLEVPASSPAGDGTGTWTTSSPLQTSFIWPTQSSPTQGSTSNPILTVAGGNNNTTILHGAVYAPNSNVNLSATNQSSASVLGGIDAWSIDLNKSAAGPNLEVGLPGNEGNRFVQVIAKGGVPGNDSSTFVVRSAIVFIDNDNNHSTFVKSWRSAS